jgi:hypothetical protein
MARSPILVQVQAHSIRSGRVKHVSLLDYIHKLIIPCSRNGSKGSEVEGGEDEGRHGRW